jgi:hypothetical protein
LNDADVDGLFEELIGAQRAKLLALARRIDPSLVADDLLQPHDHSRLASHPAYQFEDGLLAGLLSARAAFAARRRG